MTIRKPNFTGSDCCLAGRDEDRLELHDIGEAFQGRVAGEWVEFDSETAPPGLVGRDKRRA
jgi:hypothetical protein